MDKRLLALDTFRGMTIAFMILVNNPGSWASIYYPLRHAEWHGCTPTDLVFPFFLFIVGVSMSLSFEKYGNELNRALALKIALRTALIFLIGLLAHWFPFYNQSLETLRIMGILQRIALAYGIGSVICLMNLPYRLPYISLGILMFYWALLFFSVAENPYELTTNLGRQLDLMIFGESHLWNGFGVPFDPEGLLSTLPATVTVLIGYWVGGRIQMTENQDTLVKEFLFYGFIALFVGWFWDKFFPINKALWTSSYVVYTAGMAAVGLGMLIEIVDIRGQKWLTKPFVVFGTNSLFAFVLSGVLSKFLQDVIIWKNEAGEWVHGGDWLYESIFQPTFGAMNGSLMFGVSFVALCWGITGLLYRKNIFIKI